MTGLQLFPLLLLVFLSTVVSTLLVLYCVHYVRRYGTTTQVTTFETTVDGADGEERVLEASVSYGRA